ncbi:hypothetical protein PQZ66_gp63 [Klebsiella phage vB_KleM_KB2]|nr:hypothetical protein PQZ66_gp63 [Klebsiella phage vB_KleM_KB2]
MTPYYSIVTWLDCNPKNRSIQE